MTREQAAEYLGVSTRTIDRYVKKWKLSYKKIANKVLLGKEEVDLLQGDFELLRQDGILEGSREHVVAERPSNTHVSSHAGTGHTGNVRSESAWVREFVEVLDKKDRTIEEKNQMIFLLQRKIGEMEMQMKQMIALPDHTLQKEDLVKSLQHLESQKLNLEDQIRKERMMNVIFIGLALLAVAVLVFFTMQ